MLKQITLEENIILNGVELKEGQVLLIDEDPKYYFKETDHDIIPVGIVEDAIGVKSYLVVEKGVERYYQSKDENKYPLQKIKETFEYMLHRREFPPLREEFIPVKGKNLKEGVILPRIFEKSTYKWFKGITRKV
jgi:hypothetical protein